MIRTTGRQLCTVGALALAARRARMMRRLSLRGCCRIRPVLSRLGIRLQVESLVATVLTKVGEVGRLERGNVRRGIVIVVVRIEPVDRRAVGRRDRIQTGSDEAGRAGLMVVDERVGPGRPARARPLNQRRRVGRVAQRRLQQSQPSSYAIAITE